MWWTKCTDIAVLDMISIVTKLPTWITSLLDLILIITYPTTTLHDWSLPSRQLTADYYWMKTTVREWRPLFSHSLKTTVMEWRRLPSPYVILWSFGERPPPYQRLRSMCTTPYLIYRVREISFLYLGNMSVLFQRNTKPNTLNCAPTLHKVSGMWQGDSFLQSE